MTAYTTMSWIAASGGSWDYGSNWSGGIAPGATDDLLISTPGGVSVTTPDNAHALTIDGAGASLDIFTGGTVALGGQLRLEAGSLMLEGGTLAGGTIIATGGTLDAFNGTLLGVTVEGTLALADPNLTIDGITLLGADGTGTGVLTIGAGIVNFGTTQTIAAGTIYLGANNAPNVSPPTIFDFGGSTLTLGGAVLLETTGPAEMIGGIVVNAGTIVAAVGGDNLSITGSLLNQGLIDITSHDQVTVGTSATLTNTGTISVTAGGTLALLGGFSNTGSIEAAGGTILVGGQVTQAELLSLLPSGGTIIVAGTLDNTGGTLQLGPGSPLGVLTLGSGGAIRNGVIPDAGTGLIGAGGMLDGVAYQGTLNLSHAGDALTLADGATAGVIDLTGDGAALNIRGDQTLNAIVHIGASGIAANLQSSAYTIVPATLTLGETSVISQTGQHARLSTVGATIVNAGTIQATLAGGSFQMDALSNSGSISVGNRDTMTMTSLVNTGQVTVASGAVLTIAQYSSGPSGHLAETNATLNLNGTVDLASLNTIRASGGVVRVGGTADLGGGMLAVGGTAALGQLRDNGVIANGTIADGGGGIAFYGDSASGVLRNVTYRGVVNLVPALSNLVVQGLTVTGASGTGAGTVNVLGAGSSLTFQDTQGFDNATINIGSNVKANTLSVSDFAGTGAMLTLGANAVLMQRGAMAEIDIDRDLGSALVNDGRIAAVAANGSLIVLGGTFVNAGAVVVANGETMTLEADKVANLAGNILGGGYWEVDANSTLNLGMDNPILNMNAKMVLNGPGSQVLYYDTTRFATTSLEQSMRYVGSAGVLVVENGRAFNDPGMIYDSGQIVLAGGTLSAQPLAIGTTGVLFGSGTVTANAIYDAGHVLAQNGELVVNAPLLKGNPVGNALIAAGATLTANAAVTVPVWFLGTTGTLALGQPGSMGGMIYSFTGDDAIDLVNVGTAGVSLSYAAGAAQGVLTVKSGLATAASLHFKGNYVTANFRATSDGHGGTLILDPPVPAGFGVTLADFGGVPAGPAQDGIAAGGTLASVLVGGVPYDPPPPASVIGPQQ